MAGHRARAEGFRELLSNTSSSDDVDLKALRSLCFFGVPEECQLRPLCWRILLRYLPLRRSEWDQFLSVQRRVYESLVVDLIANPIRRGDHEGGEPADHPLNPNPNSEWSNFFKDNEVLLQINKDVRRLCPEISFFHKATSYPCISLFEAGVDPLYKRVANDVLSAEVFTKNRSGASNLVASSKKVASEEYVALSNDQEAHWQIVERILFIYSKLNPGVKYVQGMNEILGPIYYVFASDSNKAWAEYAEADTFFCFQQLMSQIKDNFIKTLDSSSCGIAYQMNRLYDMLRDFDSELYHLLVVKQEILPQYYAFRWISLLLSQEFPLPDVIRLWDSLFSDESIFEYFLFVCVAMILNIRDQLLAGDFSSNVRLLQNYPSVDISNILFSAAELQQEHAREQRMKQRANESTNHKPSTAKE